MKFFWHALIGAVDADLDGAGLERGEPGECGWGEVDGFAELIPPVFAAAVGDLDHDGSFFVCDSEITAERVVPTGAGEGVGIVGFAVGHFSAAPGLSIPCGAIEPAKVDKDRRQDEEESKAEFGLKFHSKQPGESNQYSVISKH